MPSPLDLTPAQWQYVFYVIDHPEPPLDGYQGAPPAGSLEAIAAQMRASLSPEDLAALVQLRRVAPISQETFEGLTAVLEQSLRQAGEPRSWRGRFRLAEAS